MVLADSYPLLDVLSSICFLWVSWFMLSSPRPKCVKDGNPSGSPPGSRGSSTAPPQSRPPV